MKEILCEVIGCGSPAVWKRVADNRRCFEDYLCHRCYETICALNPTCRPCYEPLPVDEGVASAEDNAVRRFGLSTTIVSVCYTVENHREERELPQR